MDAHVSEIRIEGKTKHVTFTGPTRESVEEITKTWKENLGWGYDPLIGNTREDAGEFVCKCSCLTSCD